AGGFDGGLVGGAGRLLEKAADGQRGRLSGDGAWGDDSSDGQVPRDVAAAGKRAVGDDAAAETVAAQDESRADADGGRAEEFAAVARVGERVAAGQKEGRAEVAGERSGERGIGGLIDRERAAPECDSAAGAAQ